jgi:hypothetical protein
MSPSPALRTSGAEHPATFQSISAYPPDRICGDDFELDRLDSWPQSLPSDQHQSHQGRQTRALTIEESSTKRYFLHMFFDFSLKFQ